MTTTDSMKSKLGYLKKVNNGNRFTDNETPDISYTFIIDINPLIVNGDIEISDEEMMKLPYKIGMFSFLDNQEEDIYDESDGEELSE